MGRNIEISNVKDAALWKRLVSFPRAAPSSGPGTVISLVEKILAAYFTFPAISRCNGLVEHAAQTSKQRMCRKKKRLSRLCRPEDDNPPAMRDKPVV